MGNPFQSISDTVSDFAGDVADAWNRPGKTSGGEGKYLSYPNSLGNSSESSFEFNSDVVDGDLNKYTDARAEDGGSNSPDPFIMFEFFRVIEPDYVAKAQLASDISHLNTTSVSLTQANRQEAIDGKQLAINALEKRKAEIIEMKGKKKLNETVALYMTPAISVNDSMNYEQESRKLAAMAEEINKNGILGVGDNFSKEDVQLGGALAAGAIAGGIAYKLADLLPGNSAALATAGVAGTAGNAFGEEVLRQMGKALNPNEYMQYKTTQLRAFTFTWKMLPDSIQESLDCEDIVRIFRGAAHANRKSPVTLTVPDQVVVSFHGVSGIPAMPAMVITNVSVTYNPNAASFFKQNNNPVEMDLSVTLNEVMPIYRDDVETKGY
jgi:hypothetical protein